jgi:hypothetical protein
MMALKSGFTDHLSVHPTIYGYVCSAYKIIDLVSQPHACFGYIVGTSHAAREMLPMVGRLTPDAAA